MWRHVGILFLGNEREYLHINLALAKDTLALVGDKAVDGVQVSLGGSLDNVRVGTVSVVGCLVQSSILILGLSNSVLAIGRSTACRALGNLNRDLTQGIDTLTDGGDVKFEKTDLLADQTLDGQEDGLNRSRLADGGINQHIASLGVLQLDSSGGEGGARNNLE